MIVAALKNSAAKGVIRGDIDAALISKDACLDLPVCESGTKGERDVLMHGLEGLGDEGVACRGRFDAMRKGSVDQVNKKGRQEEGDVGVVRVVRREEIGAVGKGIRSGEELSGNMDHFQVKVSKVN